MNAKIVDLSHNNADLSYHDLAAAGIIAVIFKASEGAGFKDPAFRGHVARAQSVPIPAGGNMRTGAYGFLDATDAEAQVENFVEAVTGQGPLVHCLDFESNPAGASATAPICAAAVDDITNRFNRHPMVYGSDFLHLLSGYPDLANCPAWMARYGQLAPVPPPPFTEWKMWQYSQYGPILGRNDVDLSCYNPALFEDDAAFLAWWDSRAVTV